MKSTSHAFRQIRRAVLCLTLCLALVGCSSGTRTITVYTSTVSPQGDTAYVPVVATAEPTAIAPEATSDTDLYEILNGETAEPAPLSIVDALNTSGSDIVIGYVARTSSAFAPYECSETDLICLNQLMFESVVELNSQEKPVPLLADRWSTEIDDKGKTVWTFELRSGIRFHNGNPLTSLDVINSYNAFSASEDTGNPYYRLTTLIDSMEYVTDTVFRVTAAYSGEITLYAMTFPVVESSSIYTAMPRGTGPYWLISYTPGISMKLESNPLWWKKAEDVKTITALCYANTVSAINALNSGDIDMMATRNTSASEYRNLSNIISLDYATSTYELLVPNLRTSSVMSDLAVRRAIMYCIDRTAVQTTGYRSMLQSSEVPVVPGTWLYETQSALYYYSPERALQILYDDGWGDSNGNGILDRIVDGLLQELDLTIYTYSEDNTSVRKTAATQIANNLAAIGIRITVEDGSKDNVTRVLKSGQFDLVLIGVNFSSIPNPSSLLRSRGSLNFSGYADTEMDALCEKIFTTIDESELQSVFSSIQMKVVSDLPILGIGFRTGTILSTTSLNGLSGIRAYDVWNGLELMQLK